MRYKVQITDEASQDLVDIYNYVSKNLENPSAAENLLVSINEALLSLRDFPLRYPVMDTNVLVNTKLRKMPVENYVIIYTLSDDKIVNVVRIMFGRRNLKDILKNI